MLGGLTMTYVVIIVCLTLSGLFSGLTLGLMSLDVQTLKRKARLGDVQAAVIYPIRVRGNQLLTTLLLGNVAVNAVLAVFLGSLVSGVTASILATALIFIFGEIFPQAILTRYAMGFGAHAAPAVGLLMKISSPITYPIAWALDALLGEEIPEIYSKHELMEIISEHEDSVHSPLDRDEERIIHGALKFSHEYVRDVMTPWEHVTWFDTTQQVDASFLQTLTDEGYSRYPVLSPQHDLVLGILFIKDILNVQNGVQVGDVYEQTFLRVRDTHVLDTVLQRMLKRRQHMAVVYNDENVFVGVITLEDILEEVLQQEIFDEEDDEEGLSSRD